MLSSSSRFLTYLCALCYVLLGAALFLAPNSLAEEFAWSVSPFVLMTMGGWCLGNAVFAFLSARIWHWNRVYPALIYLWAFGLFEAAVLVAFRDRVNLGSVAALGYIITIAINVLTALIGLSDLLRLRPSAQAEGMPVPGYVRGLVIFFTINLGILALGGLLAEQGGRSTEGGIFPEPLTLFTVRAFSAFFAAIGLSALPLTWARSLTSMFAYGQAGVILIIPILIAAFANLDKFDFSARPGGILYLGAYVVTFIITAWGLWRYGSAERQVERTAVQQ
jgi:hypothetical protein